MSDAERAARAYIDCVLARDAAGIGALFAQSATITFPGARTVSGREAIEREYARIFATRPPTPQLEAATTQGRTCVAEISATFADGANSFAADVFVVDAEGRIDALRIYTR